MMVIDNKFNIGQTVYLVTDPEQLPRLVNFIRILPGELLVYIVSNTTDSSDHYDFELSTEMNLAIKTQ